ncbi:MAG: hypothetical protein EPN82_05795 [Bacteroidetes bacterium]|nr:MAG: hypothetical protein EPN82_05795 [Bacteroidota bacterium]
MEWFIEKFIEMVIPHLRTIVREEFDEAFKQLLPQENKQEHYTRIQTQQLLGVCSSTLWKYERLGILCPVRLGHRVYYKSEDIKKAMK